MDVIKQDMADLRLQVLGPDSPTSLLVHAVGELRREMDSRFTEMRGEVATLRATVDARFQRVEDRQRDHHAEQMKKFQEVIAAVERGRR